jgi:hypothetical protein
LASSTKTPGIFGEHLGGVHVENVLHKALDKQTKTKTKQKTLTFFSWISFLYSLPLPPSSRSQTL